MRRSRIRSLRYYHAHKEEIKPRAAAAKKAYRESHRDEMRAYSRERYQRLKDTIRATARFNKYGVTSDWVRDQLVGQAGRCAICGFVMQPGLDTCVDHDHATNRPRALLCKGCNLMIGMAKENQRTLISAAAYLASFT